MLLFTIVIFIVDSLVIAAAQMLLFLVLCLSAKIPPRKIFPHWKFLAFLAAMVVSLQILFGEGLIAGLMICCRIISLTILLPLLTMTTNAGRLSCGIVKLGVNYRSAHIITATLNLIPLFEDEARLIMDARKLRGAGSFEKGGFFSRINEYRAIALPLVIRAMRKAQIIGLAMDSRAFGAYKTRTWIPEIRMTGADYLAFALGTAASTIAVAANFLVKG